MRIVLTEQPNGDYTIVRNDISLIKAANLFIILRNKNSNEIDHYIKSFKTLPIEIQVKQLRYTNNAGFTPLMEALISNNPKIVTDFLELFKTLPIEIQHEQLMHPNHAGFTPLGSSLKSGNPEIRKKFTELSINITANIQKQQYNTQSFVARLEEAKPNRNTTRSL